MRTLARARRPPTRGQPPGPVDLGVAAGFSFRLDPQAPLTGATSTPIPMNPALMLRIITANPSSESPLLAGEFRKSLFRRTDPVLSEYLAPVHVDLLTQQLGLTPSA